MFLNHFAFAMPSLGASFRQDELRSENLMVLRARFEGGLVDESLHRPCASRGSDWSRLRIVLEGPLAAGLDVSPGQMLVSGFDVPSRALTRSNDWLEIVWRSAAPTTTSIARLSASSLRRIRELTRLLEGDDLDAVVPALAHVLGDLGALGVSLEPPHEGPRGARFARLLWDRAMRLESQPMAVDIASALGVSERHALRQTSQFLQQFHLSASSWRELLQCLRVEMGAFFMSAPRATTEAVSRFLGFRSPTGFCHAFHDAGLPSPQAVRSL